MNSIVIFFETDKGKYFKNLVIGLGESVVLLGELFNIQHWPGGSIMLTLGMSVEVFLFALLGLRPWCIGGSVGSAFQNPALAWW